MLVGGDAGGNVGGGQVQLAELELEVALLGDALRVVDRLRMVGEEGAHLVFGPHVVAVGSPDIFMRFSCWTVALVPMQSRTSWNGASSVLDVVESLVATSGMPVSSARREEAWLAARFELGDAVVLDLEVVVVAKTSR